VGNYSDAFLGELDLLATNSESSYRSKNIGLIDYIDTQRIYLQNAIEYLEAVNRFRSAVHQLNFSVGKQVL
jgi:hypothetical protein